MRLFDLQSENRASLCRKYLFSFTAIFVLVFSIYSNTFNASWHFDDEQNILENERVHITTLDWKSIKSTFFASTEISGKTYRPVAVFSFALNYLFGKNNVLGFHLVNISVHFFAAVFLFLFIQKILNLPSTKSKYGHNSYFIALLSTVFWAANPIQTQAITYIVQRMASLAAMFFIMAMYFYLKGRTCDQQSSRFLWYLLCFASAILSFGSKENTALLPFSLFLFDLFLIQGVTKKNIKKNAIVLAVLVLVPLTLALLLKGPSFFSPSHILSGYDHRGFTLGQRLLTEPRVIVYYISLLFYPMPSRLCITHVITPSHGLLHPPTALLSILLILFILSTAIVKSRKWPLIVYCIIFFFLNHVIESTVFPLELIFEHRNYLPSMLFFVPVSILAVRAIEYFSAKSSMQFIISAFLVLIIIGLGHSTFMRNFTWKTEESLWIDAVDKNPDSVRAHHNLGRYYSDIGQSKKAISEYLAALALKPETYGEKAYLTHYNLGLEYMVMGKDKKAMQQFQKAIDLFPRFADAYCNMAVIKAKKGNYKKSYDNLITSLTYNRNSAQAHNNLGYVLIKQKEYEKAIDELQAALNLRKGYTIASRNMGIAYKLQEKFQEAGQYFATILSKHPNDVVTRLHLAETFALMGKRGIAEKTISRGMDLVGPRGFFLRIKKLLDGNSFQEMPKKSIIIPLLQKAYRDRGKSLEQMGNEFLEFTNSE